MLKKYAPSAMRRWGSRSSNSGHNNTAIRVAVLLPSLQVGGAERLVLEELAFLKDDPRFAFELHLVFEKGPFFEKFSELGVPVHVWNAPHKSVHMLASYASIVRYLRRTRCQILHSHLLDGIGPLVGKMAKARVIATVHSDIQYGLIERFILGKCDLALGCGQQVVRNISRFIPVKRIARLNNATSQPSQQAGFREDAFKKFNIKPGSKLIVSLGRFTRAKGFDVLIEAFRLVADAIPDAVLLIGGDGEDRAKIQNQALSLECGDRILLPGVVSDIHELLASCDLYVNSSRWEGLPMTLLEAMSHSRPMVATRVGGNPEVVLDDVTGVLVPPEDPQQLGEAIIRVLKNNKFRSKASIAALNLFKQSYSIEQHCSDLSKHYLRLVSGFHP